MSGEEKSRWPKGEKPAKADGGTKTEAEEERKASASAAEEGRRTRQG